MSFTIEKINAYVCVNISSRKNWFVDVFLTSALKKGTNEGKSKFLLTENKVTLAYFN